MSKNKASQPPRLSIKFLVSNTIAGSIIGTGGSTIKELMEVTDARVTVSGVNDVYPGTSERIILLTGSFDSLNTAQSLLWDMFAVNAKVMNKKTVLWSPREASENSSDHDSIFVSGKITVAASAGGLLLGRGGNTLRTISEESDAKVQMSSKEQSMFTQERVIAISGNKGCCVNCVKLILNKLSEDLESAQYANKGLTYSAKIPTMLAMGASYHESISRNHNGYNNHNNHHHMSSHDDHNDNISSTKITLNVPDNLIGNILGRHGVTMREIMSLSGAKIAVSNRPDDVANTKPGDILTRTVTITGSPTQAQTAHLFITQRLQSPTPAPTRKSRSNTGPKRSSKNESGPVGTNDEEDNNNNHHHNDNNDNNESEEEDDDDVDEEEEDNDSDHK